MNRGTKIYLLITDEFIIFAIPPTLFTDIMKNIIAKMRYTTKTTENIKSYVSQQKTLPMNLSNPSQTILLQHSKTNIEKLKQNKLKQYEELRENEIIDLNIENEKLQDKILELEYKIVEQETSLEEQRLYIEEKNSEILKLQKELYIIQE